MIDDDTLIHPAETDTKPRVQLLRCQMPRGPTEQADWLIGSRK